MTPLNTWVNETPPEPRETCPLCGGTINPRNGICMDCHNTDPDDWTDVTKGPYA
jgi:uncharacterized OB-fold protein